MKSTLIMFIILFLAACNPLTKSFVAGKKEDDKSAKKADEDADAERVDVPNNIAGSYLMCSLRKDASSSDPSSEYGCRLNEAGTMNKLDLSAWPNRVQWQSNLNEGILITSYPANSVWHALYTITASDLSSLREKTAQMQIQVAWSSADGATVAPFKDQKLAESLQPAAAAGDTTAPILQDQGLDPSDPGTL